MRKHDGIQIYDTNFRKLDPRTCFEDVTADGTNTILLIHNEPQAESVASQPNPAFNSQVERGDVPGPKKSRLELQAAHSNEPNNRG
jgi:hypothetical protein